MNIKNRNIALATVMLVSILCPSTSHAIEYGEKRMMRITAYYSPLPDQENYVTGSYEKEKRLNGHGIRGADNTEVYPGMIAAPKNIPFGTIICIPTYGCGAKHDTGGAIVEAGERALAKYDRLDLWLGYGDKGLNRALAWGLQDHRVTLYPAGSNLGQYVDLNLPMGILDFLGEPLGTEINRNLIKNMKGDDVYLIQKKLQEWGYLDHEPTGFFGGQTERALVAFQLAHGVIDSGYDTGAGVFGNKTRNAFHLKMQPEIYEKLQEKYDTFKFRRELNHEERSFDVYMMQALLEYEGFFDDHVGGFFGPITKKSVTDFQLYYGIIKSESQAYAGYMGPRTKLKLNERLAHFRHSDNYPNAQNLNTNTKPSINFETLNGSSLYKEVEGNRVRQLQKALRHLGYLKVSDTGYYGTKTRNAIIAFQIDHGVIPYDGAQGTGVYGPGTQAKMKEIWMNQN